MQLLIGEEVESLANDVLVEGVLGDSHTSTVLGTGLLDALVPWEVLAVLHPPNPSSSTNSHRFRIGLAQSTDASVRP